MLSELRGIQEKYQFIGDVRGSGLLIGPELVRDRKSKEPVKTEVTRRLFQETLKRGIVSMNYKAAFRINPPLILTKEEAEKGVQILDEAFGFMDRHLPWES